MPWNEKEHKEECTDSESHAGVARGCVREVLREKERWREREKMLR